MSSEIKLPEVSRRQFLKYGLAVLAGGTVTAVFSEPTKTLVQTLEQNHQTSPTTYPDRTSVYFDPTRSAWPPQPFSVIDAKHPSIQDEVLKQDRIDGPQDMGKEQIMQFVRRMDNVVDMLPEVAGPKTVEELKDWTREIINFFDYEGITKNPIIPTEVGFKDYKDGESHNHILGQASCFSGEAYLNGRFNNPYSSWFGRGDSIQAWVHELAHIQGVCSASGYSSEVVESSAQLISLEVMSGMYNKGNTKMAKSLYDELRYMGIQSLYYIASQEGKEDEFFSFRRTIIDDPIWEASQQKSRRYWAENPLGLRKILRNYNYIPFQQLMRGLRADKGDDAYIEGVLLPAAHQGGGHPFGEYIPSSGPDARDGHLGSSRELSKLKCDDLWDVIKNAEERAGRIAAMGKS